MSLSMTLMICVIIFFVIVTPLILVDYVKDSRRLKGVEDELEHYKSENSALSQIVEFRDEDIHDLKVEVEKANEEIKRLTEINATANTITVVRTVRPLSTVTCCIEIPNELLYDKGNLEEYEIRRMEDAFMHKMYAAFKQYVLPSAEFTIEEDFEGFRKRLVCRIPVTVPPAPSIDMDKEHPIVDLIIRLSREPRGRSL